MTHTNLFLKLTIKSIVALQLFLTASASFAQDDSIESESAEVPSCSQTTIAPADHGKTLSSDSNISYREINPDEFYLPIAAGCGQGYATNAISVVTCTAPAGGSVLGPYPCNQLTPEFMRDQCTLNAVIGNWPGTADGDCVGQAWAALENSLRCERQDISCSVCPFKPSRRCQPVAKRGRTYTLAGNLPRYEPRIQTIRGTTAQCNIDCALGSAAIYTLNLRAECKKYCDPTFCSANLSGR